MWHRVKWHMLHNVNVCIWQSDAMKKERSWSVVWWWEKISLRKIIKYKNKNTDRILPGSSIDLKDYNLQDKNKKEGTK